MEARIRTLLAAAVVVFGLATAVSSQPDAVLTGVVHDHTGAPAVGAVVTIAHPEQKQVRVVATNLYGEYAVAGLDRHTIYEVHVSHPQFRKARLQARADGHLRVQLKPRRGCLGRRC